MNKPINSKTNRALWAEPPHHRPDNYLYMPDPSIPLHEQTLLGVPIPPQTKEEQNEKDWELNEVSIYDFHKAQLNATSTKLAETVKQLEQEQNERFLEQYPEYIQPEPVRSQSHIRKTIGA